MNWYIEMVKNKWQEFAGSVEIANIQEAFSDARKVYEVDNDKWWEGLTEVEREDAFYAVIKRMHTAEIKDQGSYRYALYNVFGFAPNMYTQGMHCGYFDLHNALVPDIDEDDNV